MSRSDEPETPRYGERMQRRSLHLIYVVAAVFLLMIVVFSGLHIFGQRLGVQI